MFWFGRRVLAIMMVSARGMAPWKPRREEGDAMGTGFEDRKQAIIEKTLNGETYE